MKTNPKVIAIYACFLLSPPLAIATEEWHPFNVEGEQLEFTPPLGWKLAYMIRKSNDQFFAEYIPNEENINAWKTGYLSTRRALDHVTLKKARDANTQIAEAAMPLVMRMAEANCKGKAEPLPQKSETINGYNAVTGGFFCADPMPVAPYGEGALFALIEGRDYLHTVQYSWRPTSKEQLNTNLPWRIDPLKSRQYLESIRSVSLCGGEEQPECKIKYVD